MLRRTMRRWRREVIFEGGGILGGLWPEEHMEVTLRSAFGCPVEPPSLGANATGIELDVSCVSDTPERLGQRVLGAKSGV